ncbi:hypothetical protein HPB51_010847 [Rhipicephalus microplus]|uniref:Uncharacterized protein n=1 Tax=Rhipicephalus microplus TaxID=6941 RepID=A0A9J6DLW1_RHIMP|nr:hypothetical protein HPB51_010847 [Rhipicephalus microplus]
MLLNDVDSQVVEYVPSEGLSAHRYRKGFCRFCQLHYRTKGLDNPFVHLTNVSVQRHGGRYNQSHGGKWSLSSLEMFLRGTRGSASAARLRQDLKNLVAHSLTAVAPSMMSDRHCFELYGYDVLLDEQLRPWLLEVNASPSLTASTRADALLKQALVDDVLRLVAPSGKPPARAERKGEVVRRKGDGERRRGEREERGSPWDKGGEGERRDEGM